MAATAPTTKVGTNYIDGLLSGTKWFGVLPLTYSFPTDASGYRSSYGAGEPFSGFAAATSGQISTVRFALEGFGGTSGAKGFSVEGFTDLSFDYAADSGSADIRVARTDRSVAAHAYLPHTLEEGGDLWFSKLSALSSPVAGNYAWLGTLHELGHALGLKHPHETSSGALGTFPIMDSEYDMMQYSLMSYRSYENGNTGGGYSNETWGYAQSFMMCDIAALQEMYGADFTTNSGDNVYSWAPGSGNTMIDGSAAITPGGNRIFLTIWDGGGEDTYDFSAYSSDLSIDLRPGHYSKTGAGQAANLGHGHYADGNVYNAFQYDGDARSLIENANGGSGDDTLRGNSADNRLDGRGGSDDIFAGLGNNEGIGGGGNDDITFLSGAGDLRGDAGNDILAGGFQADKLSGGAGNDAITGDLSKNFGGSDVIEGGAGNDYLQGGLGADSFVFNPNAGSDVIGSFEQSDITRASNGVITVNVTGADFETGIDMIRLTGFSGVNSSNVMNFVSQGSDGAIFSAEGTNITFFGVDASALSADDFAFV